MSLATLIMAGAIMAGLFCTLVLGLVATTLLVLPILALRRVRPQPPRRQPVRRVAHPSREDVQTPPGDRATANAPSAAAAERTTSDVFDGFTGLYTSGLVH